MDWICETLNNAEALEKANARIAELEHQARMSRITPPRMQLTAANTRIAAMERLLKRIYFVEDCGIQGSPWVEQWKADVLAEFPGLAQPPKSDPVQEIIDNFGKGRRD
jgi:hypothetical protein